MAREVVTKKPSFVVYNDGTILCKNIRFSYVHAAQPWRKLESDDLKYSIVGLIPRSKPEYRPLIDVLKGRMEELRASAELGMLADDKKFLRNGDKGSIEQHKGYLTISSSATLDRPPSLRGPEALTLSKEKAIDQIRSGYWGDILIKPWAMRNKHGRRVNAELIAVQVKRKDKTFGQQRIGEDELDETFDASDEWDDSSGGFDNDDDSGYEDGADDLDDL